MWHLGAWFNVGHGSAVLMVGLDDLKVLFQSKYFHELVLKFKNPGNKQSCESHWHN